MRCFMNKNTEYELLVKDIFQTLANEESSTTISIQHNIKIVGISGQNHQIDVYYEFLFMGQKHKVIIECKNYSRRVSLDKLETFHSVLTDIGDVKGIFVSKNGFQEGAIRYAKCYGIILKVLRHPTASDWIGTVKDIFISLNMSHIEVTNIEILFDKKWIKDQYGNCEIQCSAKTNEIIGGEALLRLFNEDGNMVPIQEFLPILNENGYIRMMDLWEYEKVLKRMDQRLKEHKKIVNMSFNISNSHFHDSEIFSDYKNISERYDVPRNMITCEFLESISIDEKKMNELIKEFHEEGFQCALDDFGNGCSSFNVLRYADIDIVKIDRCFFEESPRGNKVQILTAIVEMLKILGMHIVAEGVEEKEDVELVQSLGVDEIQGFYYYRPMPMEDFFALLDKEDKE